MELSSPTAVDPKQLLADVSKIVEEAVGQPVALDQPLMEARMNTSLSWRPSESLHMHCVTSCQKLLVTASFGMNHLRVDTLQTSSVIVAGWSGLPRSC